MSGEAHLFGRLLAAVKSSKRILLVAHKKPDGDTLGSSSAMLNWLLDEGKDTTAFCRDLPSPLFRYLDQIHRYTSDPVCFEQKYDLVMVFDSGDLQYCGVADLVLRLPSGYLLANIDHHATNAGYGGLNLVFTEASSTAEIVYRFFETNRLSLNSKIATSLLTGLMTDTGGFINAGTTVMGMEAAARCFSAGARFRDILNYLLHNRSVELLKIWGLMLSRLRYNSKLDLCHTYILRHEVPANLSDAPDGMSNFLNAVSSESDAVLVLKEMPNGEIKGSLRSHTRDISKLARILGGGGHKKAAGFTLRGRIEVTPRGPRIVDSSE